MAAALTPAAADRRAAAWLLVLAWLVYAFSAGGSLTSTDASVTFDVTRQMVERHTLALSGNLLGYEAERGRDGRFYSPFGIGQSIFNVPFFLIGTAAAKATGLSLGKPDTIPKAVVAMSQTLVAAMIVAQTFALALRLTGSRSAAALSALTLAFGSLLWPYARFGFNQPLAAATLLAGVAHAYAAGRTGSVAAAGVSGLWIAASLLTRHEMVLAAGPLVAWMLWSGVGTSRERVQRAVAFGAIVAIGFGVWMALNLWRFGHALDPGLLRDSTPGLGSSIASGVAGLLLSPGASLFLYSPMAVLGVVGLARLARRDLAGAMLCASMSLTFVLFYATLGNWLGGRSYGSRYLLVVLPVLTMGWAAWLADMTPARRRRAFAAVFLIGALVQLPGVLVDFGKVSEQRARREGAFTTAERQWSWHASSLVLNTEALMAAAPANLAYLGGAPRPSVAPPRDDTDRGFSSQFDFSLDVWWLYLFHMQVLSPGGVAVVVLAFVLAIGVAIRQLVRALTVAAPPDRVLHA